MRPCIQQASSCHFCLVIALLVRRHLVCWSWPFMKHNSGQVISCVSFCLMTSRMLCRTYYGCEKI
ncbi:hypothetical protein F2P79_004057 [Pimephales promelas]|nr:hypothetical protein F2P79_004057 [Pimephales promelas]